MPLEKANVKSSHKIIMKVRSFIISQRQPQIPYIQYQNEVIIHYTDYTNNKNQAPVHPYYTEFIRNGFIGFNLNIISFNTLVTQLGLPSGSVIVPP